MPRLKAEWMRVELPMLHCERPPPSFSAKFRLMLEQLRRSAFQRFIGTPEGLRRLALLSVH